MASSSSRRRRLMMLHGPPYSTTAASPSSTATATTTKKKPKKKKESFKRLPSIDEVSTAPTEFCSSYGSSTCRVIDRHDDHQHDDDDLDDFLESLESICLNDDKEEEDVLTKLMSYEQHTKFIINEQQHQEEQEEIGRADLQTVNTTTTTTDVNIDTTSTTTTINDTLEVRIAKFQQRHKKRQHNRQSRIIKAQDDYIECLRALASSTATTSSAFDDEEEEHDLVWKEVRFD